MSQDYDSTMFELFEIESELQMRLSNVLDDIPGELWKDYWDRLWCSYETIKSQVDEYLQDQEDLEYDER
jgi:hypothetical protein